MILHLGENKDIEMNFEECIRMAGLSCVVNRWDELKEKLNQMVFDEKNKIKACGYNEVLRLMCKIEKGEVVE